MTRMLQCAVHAAVITSTITAYNMYQEESSILRENAPLVNLY